MTQSSAWSADCFLKVAIVMADASSSDLPFSSYQDFDDGVRYALSQLQKSHLKLKDQQLQAIHAVYSGKDVFVFLPTGFGKSICYQVLPFLFDHRSSLCGGQKWYVVVVSPLISLMADQVRALRSNSVSAVVISSTSRESSIVHEYLATDKSLMSSSIIFTSLIYMKWREKLENPVVSGRVCVCGCD